MLGIVIVNWNNFRATGRFVDEVFSKLKLDCQLIVVNNDVRDTDALNALVNGKEISVISNTENMGYAHALNQGITSLISSPEVEWLMVVNSDISFDKGFAELLAGIDALDKGTIYSPVGLYSSSRCVENTGGKIVALIGGAVHINKGRDFSKIRRISPDFLCGYCLLFHKEIFQKVGGFDTNYFAYYEDVDFSYRARAVGYRLEVIWEAQVLHDQSGSTRNMPAFKRFLLARNEIVFAKKNLRGLKKSLFLVMSLLRQAISGFFTRSLKIRLSGIRSGMNNGKVTSPVTPSKVHDMFRP